MFVARALQSALTIVLLCAEIRPGTMEELEAVLNDRDAKTQLAVIWFDADTPASAPAHQVAEYLHASGANQRLFHLRAGSPDSDDAWFAIARVIIRSVISATAGTFTTIYTPNDAEPVGDGDSA